MCSNLGELLLVSLLEQMRHVCLAINAKEVKPVRMVSHGIVQRYSE
jgi:hypothetical protein